MQKAVASKETGEEMAQPGKKYRQYLSVGGGFDPQAIWAGAEAEKKEEFEGGDEELNQTYTFALHSIVEYDD